MRAAQKNGSAEAATSPSHGSHILNQEIAVNGRKDTTSTQAGKIEHLHHRGVSLARVGLDMMERMLNAGNALRSSEDGASFTFCFSRDEIDDVIFLAAEAEENARMVRDTFIDARRGVA